MTFPCKNFLDSLQNPTDEKSLIISLETLIYNGFYEYSNPLSLLTNLFRNVKDLKGAREKLICINIQLAEEICNLVDESIQVDNEFMTKIDEILYPYI